MVDARDYHDRTKHTPEGVRESDFSLDFENKPRPYKVYEDRPRVESPGEPRAPGVPALSAIATATPDPGLSDPGDVTADRVHSLCHYATGVTKELELRGEQVRFRAASCTGKLYHVDLYAVTGDLPGLDAGVYHFDPDSGGFDVLREGDYRGVLADAAGRAAHGTAPGGGDAAGGAAGVADAPVTFVATSEWWRNAWKYRERTYRHAFWDSGTVLANLLAASHGFGHRAQPVLGFADDPVVDLLGVDPSEEAPLELVPVGSGDPVPDAPRVDAIDPAETPLSENPVDYPLIPDAWEQSALSDADAARDWRERARDATRSDLGLHAPGSGDTIELDPVDEATASSRPVENTIERRGSLREYSHHPISDRKLATILDRALPPAPTDAREPGDRVLDCYVLAHAVDGIPSAAYQYHRREGVLERVAATDRTTAGHIAVEQGVVGDAAANVYLTADVDRIVDELGNRGYRLAQLQAGVALGRLYLATYAHRTLGGRGFTFYDDQVSDHLSPRASNQTPMTLFALGKPET